MAEEHHELQTTLGQLHDQLHGAKEVPDETRQRLRALINDIHAALGTSGPASAASAGPSASRASIVQRLRDAELEFEATHPTLAGIVGSIASALGQMGI